MSLIIRYFYKKYFRFFKKMSASITDNTKARLCQYSPIFASKLLAIASALGPPGSLLLGD